jgi:diguanylate cyclase (GGDEF)-like protein/PAS domain S-box-containing protein
METKPYTLPASFIDLLIDAVFAVDVDGRVLFASAACERIFGYTPQEMLGRVMFDMMVPQDRERTRQSVQQVMAGQPQLNFENRYIRKDGQIAYIMWSTRWSAPDQVRIGIARDVTQRKRAESKQAVLYAISEATSTAEDLPTLFQNIHQIIGTLLVVDNFAVALYDQESKKLSFPYHIDTMPETCIPVSALCEEAILNGQPLLLTSENMQDYLSEQQITVKTVPLCWLGVPLKSQNGTIGVLVCTSYPGGTQYNEQDQELLQFVSTQIATAIERQQMQARLQYMAQYDQLTALPNRALLYDRLNVALLKARRERGHLSMLFLDLDKFKQVNDTLGHHVGDRLLQEVARRLKQCLRESDTVARVGGDEFVILLQPIPLPEHAALVKEKIRDALRPPISIDKHSLTIVPSIGIAHYPDHGDNEEQLLKYADQAMYAEKHGRPPQTLTAELGLTP